MTDDPDRLLADPDALRRHLRAAGPAAEPDSAVAAEAVASPPEPLPDHLRAAVLASPALLLAVYAARSTGPPAIWSPALGEAGRQCYRLDLTPPTWEEVASEVPTEPARPPAPVGRVEDAVPAIKLSPSPLREAISAGPRLSFQWSWERTPAEVGWDAPGPSVVFTLKSAANAKTWELGLKAGGLPGPVVVRLTRIRDGRTETTAAVVVGAGPIALAEPGPAGGWLDDWTGGLRVTVCRAGIDPPTEAVETIPGPRFDTDWVSAWGRHPGFGFPACFQVLSRRTGQPALVFRELVAQLRKLAYPPAAAGTRPLRGWREMGETICMGAWKQVNAEPDGWRSAHPTPLGVVLGKIDQARAGVEWGPLLADLTAAVGRLAPEQRQALADPADPRGPLAWHRLLAGLAEAGQPPARAVDLLLPIVPFGPADDGGGK